MDLKEVGFAARAAIEDWTAGLVRRTDSKGIKVAAGGAALALVLGLGAGFVGRAPIDRALHPEPMKPVPGTSQIATATPPLTEAPAPAQAAPVSVAYRDDTPTIATGDEAPDVSQDVSTDETQADTPVADSAPGDSQPTDPRPPRHRYTRPEFSRFEEAPPAYAPPWAYRAPPPPPDDNPD